MRKESVYRSELVQRIEDRFPGCVIVPTDPQRQQGIPDIVILFKKVWAILELKRATNAARRPNQTFFVDKFNDMSFAAVIYPENEERVLNDLQSTLGL